MKKLLPKSALGFSLIELLIVIAIIAILSAISMVIFNGVQKNARDARRREDIDAIAKAIEMKKSATSSTYSFVTGADFASSVVPTDTGTPQYSIAESATALPALPSAWPLTQANPTGYSSFAPSMPTATAVFWRVCALLESTGVTTPNVYCKANVQ